MADQEVDNKYLSMRSTHGHKHASANGYLFDGFFRREKRYLASRVKPGLTLDAACGSALMLKESSRHELVGLDFNQLACEQALSNGVNALRGDVYATPFANDTFDAVINCQFLNQQSEANGRLFVFETARILKSGGECHILWRGADTAIHRTAHFLDSTLRRITGKEIFPQFFHEPRQLITYAECVGLKVHDFDMTLPFGPPSIHPDKPLARFIGASYYLKLVKTAG